jgi:hypothetical protein
MAKPDYKIADSQGGRDETALRRLWREKRGEAVRARLKSASITIDYFPRLSFTGVRSRTPGPPPFWSMNSTPAASKARRIASSFCNRCIQRVSFCKLTPISPASSSLNLMPDCSRAFCIFRIVEKFPFTTPSFCSIRWSVVSPTPASRASLSWLQPKSERAARI